MVNFEFVFFIGVSPTSSPSETTTAVLHTTEQSTTTITQAPDTTTLAPKPGMAASFYISKV